MLAAILVAGTGVAAAGDKIRIPIRWCVIGDDQNGNGVFDPGEDGTPAYTNPAGVGETETDDVLWRRHERATDEVWMPGAEVSFRSAFTHDIKNANDLHFPVIEDPCSTPACAGVYGDIRDPYDDNGELLDAYADCEAAWDDLEQQYDANIEGPIVISLRLFVEADDSTTPLIGIADSNVIPVDVFQFCDNPPDVIGVTEARAAVVDNSFFTGNFQYEFDTEHTLAHELGHVFNLGHGNGLDDDDDGRFDQNCDGDENINALPESLMTQSSESNVITDLQRLRSRAVAMAVDGATLDPPGVVDPGDVVGDHRSDPAHDVATDWLDMITVSWRENSAKQTVFFTHAVYRTIPHTEGAEYIIFFDLDDDPLTGGEPMTLGFATAFEGAELVTRVEVQPAIGALRPVIPTVWRYSNGMFVEIQDPAITAELITSREFEFGLAISDRIVLQMPRPLLGGPLSMVRIQALAQNLDETDRLPTARDGGEKLRLVLPVFPECVVDPLEVEPGAMVVARATGLLANDTAKVFLGEDFVAMGPTDADGKAEIPFAVPLNATAGPRLVTVGIMNTALTADCFLEVARRDVLPDPAGEVPFLTARRDTANRVVLDWDRSCLTTDQDFEVYEGDLDDFGSHTPVVCSTGGATQATVTPRRDRAYYLVVPRTGVREGSYGRDSNLLERGQGPFACLAQDLGVCPP